MKIALQNSWPNIPKSAEAEFIRRALKVCGKLGFDAHEVVTSDDIQRLRPDCVLVTHEYSPKLTSYPTLGLLWSPCSFYATDPIRRKSILSYDAYLCASEDIVEWLEAFLNGQGKRPLIMDGLFLPSSPDCGPAGDLPAGLAVMYAGIHWDGNRYKSIFEGLSQCVPMNIYGPSHKWKHVGDCYRGALPFDGRSVITAIRASGIALCLHKPEHRAYNCPSMRLFEAAAAGALIISDDFGFPRYWFRDSVLYVDAELPPALVVDQIKDHVDWAYENPEAANHKAHLSSELFRRNLSLDRMLERLPEFVDQVRQRCFMVISPGRARHEPTVEYIVRIGARPVSYVSRALDSLANQTHQAIAVTLVQFHPLVGIEELIARYRPKFRWLRRQIVPNDGRRSTAWWAGLNSIEAEFFAILDDDDGLHPNHVATVLEQFDRHPECGFIYSGAIRVEEEEGHYVDAINFQGPGGKIIQESRELKFLDPPDLARLVRFDNYIQSNAWICRSSVLDLDLLQDPRTEYAEDMYFYMLVAKRTAFGFTGSPTAVWNWRSASKDNYMLSFDPTGIMDGIGRLRERIGGTVAS